LTAIMGGQIKRTWIAAFKKANFCMKR